MTIQNAKNTSSLGEQISLGIMYLIISIASFTYIDKEPGYALLAWGNSILTIIQLIICFYIFNKSKNPASKKTSLFTALFEDKPKNIWSYISFFLFFIIIGLVFFTKEEDSSMFIYILLLVIIREAIVFFYRYRKQKSSKEAVS